mmetsp:Transcript_12298/g.31028  ORF Transcript_12298/g.31028 Transcript_12298/m.31028 type:complete len:83 (-) Transcript_12298:23-271(-)
MSPLITCASASSASRASSRVAASAACASRIAAQPYMARLARRGCSSVDGGESVDDGSGLAIIDNGARIADDGPGESILVKLT